MKGFHVVIFIIFITPAYSWDTDDLELFDLVEEINSNFYEELGVKNDAGVSEIRKAYRKLSLQYHPDKNKEEGAEVKFRHLVAMYEVLKDEEKRKKYDQVLEFGLPDWRQPVYYYRKVRKLGLLEMMVILFAIFTVGHFLVLWAAYLEKKFEMEEVFNSRRKKEKRGRKAKLQAIQEEEMEEELQRQLESLPRPQGRDLLPVKLTRGLYHLVTSVPGEVRAWRAEQLRKKAEKREREAEIARELEEAAAKNGKRPKRKRVQVYQEVNSTDLGERPVSYTPVHNTHEEQSHTHKTEEWTSKDFHLLAKAVAKYPGGTANRWDKIAAMLNRDVAEVIAKNKERKTDLNKVVDTAAQGITGNIGEDLQIKKGKSISADISKRSDFVGDGSHDNIPANDTLLDKISPKNTKQSTTHRTLKTAQDSSITNQTGSSIEQKFQNEKTQSESKSSSSKVKKVVSFNNETQSITSEALSKSMREKSSKVTLDTTDSVGGSSGEGWTQNQQKIFEWGLTQYPRGVEDRWGKIAEHIPGKNKEDCITRFKFLAEVVKKKKQMQQQ